MSYYLIDSMLIVLLMTAVLTVLLIAGGENVTIKSRSIAIGMTTGTIGSTALKGGYKDQHFAQVTFWEAIYLHQQTNETATMYLVVMWKNTMTSFWNMSTASAPIHIHVTSVK